MSELASAHAELRPLMFSIAYRMLGSVAEAEDVVQEAFLRLHKSAADGVVPRSPDALATTVTTRLAIDALRSARRRREEYVGSWLPEVLLDDDSDPAHQIELDDTVSIAFLVVLERLSPVERAVFLLREVFAYGYAEIAVVVDKSEDNCRQILARARRHVDDGRPRFDPSARRRAELSERFFAALRDGDVAGLERILADDVMFYADGGGKAPAVRAPIRGAVQVARFLVGLIRLAQKAKAQMEPVLANGQPAAKVLSADGLVLGVLSLDIELGRVTGLRNQINPDKLGHLGAVGDLTALIAGANDDVS